MQSIGEVVIDPLDEVISILREAVRQVQRAMQSGEEEMAKAGALLAKLSDSLARVLLARQKLQAADPGQALASDFARWLRLRVAALEQQESELAGSPLKEGSYVN